MGLKIKTFREILSSMVDWTTSNNSKLTNFYVGSVVRTLFEAVAVEVESIYFQMYKGFKSAIENSIFSSFGFDRIAALPSSGEVLFLFKNATANMLVIRQGYKISTVPVNGQVIYFEVAEDTVVYRGAYSALVTVKCSTPGVIGNVPANVITLPLVRMTEVESITNPQAFYNGAEEESKEDRKKRFNQYINNLSRGTVSAIQYGCLRVNGVAGAYVDEGIGYVTVHVHDSAGNLTDQMKADIMTSLQDYRAAGIEVQLIPVSKRAVDINVSVTLETGFDPTIYKTTIANSITTFLNGFPVSKNLIKAELIKHIMSIDENAILNTTIDLAGDVIINKYDLIRSGNIVVTVS